MRALIQRVSQASVAIGGENASETIGSVGRGFAVFVGIARADERADIDYIVSKTVNLRVFADDEGRFNLSALDIGAELLVISQFTLYADTRRGRRPSFTDAAPPSDAAAIFDDTLSRLPRYRLTRGHRQIPSSHERDHPQRRPRNHHAGFG